MDNSKKICNLRCSILQEMTIAKIDESIRLKEFKQGISDAQKKLFYKTKNDQLRARGGGFLFLNEMAGRRLFSLEVQNLIPKRDSDYFPLRFKILFINEMGRPGIIFCRGSGSDLAVRE